MAKKQIVFGDPASYPDPILEVQKWWRDPVNQKWLHPSQRRKSRISSVKLVIEIEQDDTVTKKLIRLRKRNDIARRTRRYAPKTT